jgi:hypothetical protein
VDLPAAHRSLPFGTKVKVTNVTNNRSVVVRVNDRGPFVKGREISVTRLACPAPWLCPGRDDQGHDGGPGPPEPIIRVGVTSQPRSVEYHRRHAGPSPDRPAFWNLTSVRSSRQERGLVTGRTLVPIPAVSSQPEPQGRNRSRGNIRVYTPSVTRLSVVCERYNTDGGSHALRGVFLRFDLHRWLHLRI